MLTRLAQVATLLVNNLTKWPFRRNTCAQNFAELKVAGLVLPFISQTGNFFSKVLTPDLVTRSLQINYMLRSCLLE